MSTSKPAPRTSLTTRTTCRICGCPHLAPVLSLGDQRIAGAFADPGGDQPVERAIPLELVRCDMTRDQEACGLIQTKHTVPGSILYSSYWYRSGVNRTMTDNLHGIARGVEAIMPLESGDLVVDIGCNDGTLLDGYQAEGLRYLGFDPSDVARYAIAKGYDVVNDFYSAQALRARRPDQKAKAITSIAMFYDLEYPRTFVADVAEALAERGIWVIELHYLPMMLEANAFDAIVHEHLEYYSLAVIERLVGEEGLEVVSAELNDMNGGSIRLFIGHAGQHTRTPEQLEALSALRVKEFELALDSPEPYEAFRLGSERVRDDLRRDVQEAPRRRQEDPRLRRFDEGQHDSPVRRSRQHLHRGGGRPQSGQVRLGDDRHEDPDHQRGGVAGDEPGLLPRVAVALPRGVPRARAGVPQARREVHRAAARGACGGRS